jgi:hypothetical protein
MFGTPARFNINTDGKKGEEVYTSSIITCVPTQSHQKIKQEGKPLRLKCTGQEYYLDTCTEQGRFIQKNLT